MSPPEIAFAATCYLVGGWYTGRMVYRFLGDGGDSDTREVLSLFAWLGWPLVFLFVVLEAVVRVLLWTITVGNKR